MVNKRVKGRVRSKLKPEQIAEAARLNELWVAFKSAKRVSQEKFAADNGLKSQANMNHYLEARQGLNINAAIGFAKGMRCKIEDFSPTVATEFLALLAELPHATKDSPLVTVGKLERDLLSAFRDLRPPRKDAVFGNAMRLLVEQHNDKGDPPIHLVRPPKK